MTIRETIRQGQKLICVLHVQRRISAIREQAAQMKRNGEYIAFLVGAREDYVWPAYPPSLGELCLSMFQEAYLYQTERGEPMESQFAFYPSREDYRVPNVGPLRITLGDMAALRRALYHRRLS